MTDSNRTPIDQTPPPNANKPWGVFLSDGSRYCSHSSIWAAKQARFALERDRMLPVGQDGAIRIAKWKARDRVWEVVL